MAYYCNSCGKTIDSKIACYSFKHFGGNYLCRQHQPTPYAWALIEYLEENTELDVRFEESDGHKVVDILLPEYKLVIEVDGGYHNDFVQRARDKIRDKYSKADGYETIHVKNNRLETEDDIEEWVDEVLEPALDELENEEE